MSPETEPNISLLKFDLNIKHLLSVHRSSLIRYSSSTLPALSTSSLLHRQSSKSSESDLSTSTLPNSSSTLPLTSSSSHNLSKLPLSQPETGLLQNTTSPSSANKPTSSSTPPGAPVQRPLMPQTSLALTPPRDVPPCGFNGCPANHQAPSPASRGNPGLVLPLGAGSPGSASSGELVPVALGRSESGGLGFSLTAGGQGGQLAVVRRVWDRRHCPSLQAGDAIVKINGADVQSLSFSQVKHGYSSNIWPDRVQLVSELQCCRYNRSYRCGGRSSDSAVGHSVFKSDRLSCLLSDCFRE